MYKTKKIPFIIILLFAAVLSVAALYSTNAETAYADGNFSGEGTEENPFVISTKEQLILLSDLVNGGSCSSDGRLYAAQCYALSNDIDMSSAAFEPIGTESATVVIWIDATAYVQKYNDNGFLPMTEYGGNYYLKDTEGNYVQSPYSYDDTAVIIILTLYRAYFSACSTVADTRYRISA